MITMLRLQALAGTLVVTSSLLVAAPAEAEAPPSPPSKVSRENHSNDEVSLSSRDRVLGTAWRLSEDRAIAATGDATGYHVLAAEERTGYRWRTVTTLSEPGMETDQWIGNSCLTADGRHAAVVYAPRHFTNRDTLFARGAFMAVVDVVSGKVTKLRQQGSLAYYNPGCGSGDKVAFTRGAAGGLNSTRLVTVNAARGTVTGAIKVDGRVSSAVPVRTNVVAAQGNRLVQISPSGKIKQLAEAVSAPFDVRVDGSDGVVFSEHTEGKLTVRHYQEGKTADLATGKLGDVSVRSGSDGRVYLTGRPRLARSLPRQIRVVDAPAKSESVSSHGRLVVESAARQGLRPGRRTTAKDTSIAGSGSAPKGAESIVVKTLPVESGKPIMFTVTPGARSTPKAGTGRAMNPRLKDDLGVQGESTGTIDEGFTCAVARNDPQIQVLQPHWRQVEWAVDQLALKRLEFTRPANWKNSGLPAWNPQEMFPQAPLRGGGRIPVSVMLGVLAQESNLWQAQRHVQEGETGNPLIGNFYGIKVDSDGNQKNWDIDFSEADCGYGVSQQTDGMRKDTYKGKKPLPPNQQKAIAVDYLTNIAAGMQTLSKKWNQVLDDTDGKMLANDGDPAKIENWYFALWAYNSGWHPKSEADANDGAWGVGWSNNPSRTDFPPSRKPFLHDNQYSDAAHPQDWAYQEKVLGWAAWPITKNYYDRAAKKWQYQAGYNQAWWNDAVYRKAIVPIINTTGTIDVNAFCSEQVNDCVPSQGPNHGFCNKQTGQHAFKCWWHAAKGWKRNNCQVECGNEANIRYSDPVWKSKERSESTDYWLPCRTGGLPLGAMIVDDTTAPAVRGGCDNSGWTNNGTLRFRFHQKADGDVPGRADFQQLGSGFGGHQWYAFARNDTASGNSSIDADTMKVTGTWTLDRQVNGWARVFVHLPARRAHTQRAPYTIHRGNGETKKRVRTQRMEANTWVSLGAFKFAGTPKVSLTNRVSDIPAGRRDLGDGTAATAWDAVAFQPLPRKPRNFVVAMGDSHMSGEGATSQPYGVEYYRDSDNNGKAQKADDPAHPGQTAGNVKFRNACHRSRLAWPRKVRLPDRPDYTIGQRVDDPTGQAALWDTSLDFHFPACSGAQTEHILPHGQENAFGDSVRGLFSEMPQIDKGYLDENTTHVLLQIGGNDAGYGEIIKKCQLGSFLCQETILRELGDTEPLKIAQPRRIKGPVRDSVLQTLQAIRTKAPSARILLMSYPVVIEGTCPDFKVEELDWMADMTELFATTMKGLATESQLQGKVTVGDPRQRFHGRGACTNANSLINNEVTTLTPGDNGPLSGETYHPKPSGAGVYASIATELLTE